MPQAEDNLSTQQDIAGFIEAYTKGALPAGKDAYPRIRKLCASSAVPMAYPSVEDAMKAIRGRVPGPDER